MKWLERGGMRSHAGAWERDSVAYRRMFVLDSRLKDFGNDSTRMVKSIKSSAEVKSTKVKSIKVRRQGQ